MANLVGAGRMQEIQFGPVQLFQYVDPFVFGSGAFRLGLEPAEDVVSHADGVIVEIRGIAQVGDEFVVSHKVVVIKCA